MVVDVFNLGTWRQHLLFLEKQENMALELVVTSSHNPIEWNGLKFIVNGRGINENELQTVTSDQDLPKSKIGKETMIESNYVDEAANLIGEIIRFS